MNFNEMPVDLEVLEETAIASAQATIQNCIDTIHIKPSELAQKMGCSRSYVSRILRGDHNLTVRTLARAMGACGFEVGFNRLPVQGQTHSGCTVSPWSASTMKNPLIEPMKQQDAMSVAANTEFAIAA